MIFYIYCVFHRFIMNFIKMPGYSNVTYDCIPTVINIILYAGHVSRVEKRVDQTCLITANVDARWRFIIKAT